MCFLDSSNIIQREFSVTAPWISPVALLADASSAPVAFGPVWPGHPRNRDVSQGIGEKGERPKRSAGMREVQNPGWENGMYVFYMYANVNVKYCSVM